MRLAVWVQGTLASWGKRIALGAAGIGAALVALGTVFAPSAGAAESCFGGFALCNLNAWDLIIILFLMLLRGLGL